MKITVLMVECNQNLILYANQVKFPNNNPAIKIYECINMIHKLKISARNVTYQYNDYWIPQKNDKAFQILGRKILLAQTLWADRAILLFCFNRIEIFLLL